MQISEDKAQEAAMHERRIERTRGALTQTISQLQEQLSPGTIAGNAGNAVKEATVGKSGRFVGQMTERIKENPVPAVLVGAGLAWLWMGGRKKDDSSIYYSRGLSTSPKSTMASRAGHVGNQASDAVNNATDQVSGAVSNVADQVAGTVSNAADTAKTQIDQLGYQAQRARYSFQQIFDENPLPVALTAAGLGALIATAVPTSDAEQRMMEPVGQQISQQARKMGDKVGQVADRAQAAARDEAQRQNLT
jgi:Protein of unknown function (DUF3618)